MNKIFLLSFFALLASCTPNIKTDSTAETSASTTVTATDTVAAPEAKTIKAVSGTVLEIQMGKDGYTAKLETSDKEIYFATISHANLDNPQQYQSVAVGAQMNVEGELWQMDHENHITVRRIL